MGKESLDARCSDVILVYDVSPYFAFGEVKPLKVENCEVSEFTEDDLVLFREGAEIVYSSRGVYKLVRTAALKEGDNLVKRVVYRMEQ